MLDQLDTILADSRRAIAAAEDAPTLEELRVRVLGRKGTLTGIVRGLGQVPPEERPRIGQREPRTARRAGAPMRNGRRARRRAARIDSTPR